MGRKAADMTPEELLAVQTRMAHLRALANEKRMATASDKRETVKALEETKARELQAKKNLVEKRTRAVERLEKRVIEPESQSDEEEAPEVVIVKAKRKQKKLVVVDSSDSDGESNVALLKQKLKNKYKTKYEAKFNAQYAAAIPPQVPQRDLLHESAREQLNKKVRKEVQDIAYRSVFGNSYW